MRITVLLVVCMVSQAVLAEAHDHEHHHHEHVIRTRTKTMVFTEAFEPKTLKVCCKSENVIVGVVPSSSNPEVMYSGTSVDEDGQCGTSSFQVVCEDLDEDLITTTATVRATCAEASVTQEPVVHLARRGVKKSKEEL